ncbi:hypothetical protein [Arthrobacter sp. JCM 19049]|uniref:hypothetical protein n=1 Tax=Arthrobacter sp. JCM 19049 TaxID=1460643 RepID=UPI0006D1C4BA|nr:hypothetical protein [Arthrobacter sp. JCM 19049]
MPIRAQVITGMILLVAIALATAGTAMYVLERHELNDRLDDSLIRTVEEYRVLAETGVDPQTKQASSTPRTCCTPRCSAPCRPATRGCWA